jgi:four helix bundle protein
MQIRSYHDLEVWQKSVDLVVQCYKVTKNFPQDETFGLVSQMRRAAVSVPANIAEGKTRQYAKEFIQYISIAHGSLAELETYFQIGGRLKYLDNDTVREFDAKTGEIGRMLTGLKKSLKRNQ